jgi:poly(hydroxyalkanoate) granule-associated protein
VQARSKKTAKSKPKQVTDQVTETWDKLEHMFEERVSRALSRLGVPTHKDIEELTKRIEQLDKSVTKLIERSQPTTKRSASRRA